MWKCKLALLLAPLITATPVSAAQPQSAPMASISKAKMDPLDKQICRTEEGTGGRLHRQRVCMTVREWKEQAQANREAAELLQRQGQSNVK